MSDTKSKYRRKRESGRMMYGPGCCAHRNPPKHMQAEVNRLRRNHPNPPRGFFR